MGRSNSQSSSYNYSMDGIGLTTTSGRFTSGSTGSETVYNTGKLDREGTGLMGMGYIGRRKKRKAALQG